MPQSDCKPAIVALESDEALRTVLAELAETFEPREEELVIARASSVAKQRPGTRSQRTAYDFDVVVSFGGKTPQRTSGFASGTRCGAVGGLYLVALSPPGHKTAPLGVLGAIPVSRLEPIIEQIAAVYGKPVRYGP